MKQNILIIDDDPMVRSAVAAFLKEVGFNVHMASTLAGARESISTRSYEAVILDQLLPDGSGIDGMNFGCLFDAQRQLSAHLAGIVGRGVDRLHQPEPARVGGLDPDHVGRVESVQGPGRHQDGAVDAHGVHGRHHVIAGDLGRPVEVRRPRPGRGVGFVAVDLGVDDHQAVAPPRISRPGMAPVGSPFLNVTSPAQIVAR